MLGSKTKPSGADAAFADFAQRDPTCSGLFREFDCIITLKFFPCEYQCFNRFHFVHVGDP